MSTHDQVAHAWAHQTGRAQNGHSMHYRGRTIYSYGQHFPIATIVDLPIGQRAVLVTSAGYSVSTAKHITITRRASSHLPTFTVPFQGEQLEAWQHQRNVDHYAGQIADKLAKAKRARVNAPYLLGDAQRLVEEHNRYIAGYQLDYLRAEMPADIADLQAHIDAAAAASRLAAAERDAQARIDNADRIARWQAGEAIPCPRTATALVRVVDDRVETSWGATVPLADALTLFRIAGICAEMGQAYRSTGVARPVGTYTLDHVGADGSIRVGCHLITLADQRVAAQLAGIDLDGAETLEAGHDVR